MEALFSRWHGLLCQRQRYGHDHWRAAVRERVDQRVAERVGPVAWETYHVVHF
jgi:hypothetical protein